MYLNTHSWFSFKYGIHKPEALLEEAARIGLRTLALTDICSTAGIPDFVRLAPKYGIRPVAGIEFRHPTGHPGQGCGMLYIGLAKNNEGFRQLNELLSPHLLDGEPLPPSAPLRMTAAPDAFFILPFSTPPRPLHPNERIGIKPSELTRLPFSPWAGQPDSLVALLPVTFSAPRDFNVHRLLRTMAHNTLLSLLPAEALASPDETFRSAAEVRAIYRDFPHLVHNAERLLAQCHIVFDGTDKTPKVFGASAAGDREQLHRLAREGLCYRYPGTPANAVARMERELDVIERMGFISYFLINHDIVRFARSRGFFHVGRGSGANSLVAYCLGITDVDPIELDLYFERFISTARRKPPDFDIDFSWKDRDEVFRYIFNKYNGPAPCPSGAPGSGYNGFHAAQVATYTSFQWRGAVRELGKAVGLPPAEIDALSDPHRSRYGGGHPSEQVRNGDTDRVVRAVVHYAQRIIGMPHQFGVHVGGILVSEEPITCYSALHRPPKGFPVVQFSLLEAEDLGLHKFDILSQRGLGHIRDAVEMVKGGCVASCQVSGNGDRGFESISHRHPATDNQQPATSIRHKTSDIGQRTTSIRHKTSDNQQLTSDNQQRTSDNQQPATSIRHRTSDNQQLTTTIDIHAIPAFKQDPAIKELLRTGDTVGCFYVESPGMRMLLKKLRVEDYLTLVAASSIIRPGVAESGMMREYILRHNDPERRKRAPKELLEIMPETYGVMVYQEDVLKVAHHYAGLSLEEADLLRRGMTARFRDRPEFKAVERKFFANCKERGHPEQQTHEIWRQIESFASFSFAKGHSASYAVESYQSLYLKAHHPLEFLVAVANNFGGFYSTEFYLHEAKRHGAVIEAPCVNTSGELCSLVKSEWPLVNGDPYRSPCTIHHSPVIYLGLANIKSLTAETVQLILHERQRNGPFAGLPELLERVPLPLEQARILIRVGALRFTGRSKPQLLWDLALLHAGPVNAAALMNLFVSKVEEPVMPELHHSPLADAYDELELLGFPLGDPFAMVESEKGNCQGAEGFTRRREDAKGNAGEAGHQSPITNRRSPTTILKKEMPHHLGKRVQMLGYVVHVKSTTTQQGQRMTFGCLIDRDGELWDSIQFPAVAARFPFRGRGVYRLCGVVEEEFGHYTLRTQSMQKLPWKVDPRYGK